MSPEPTFAAVLVAGMRRHGGRTAQPDGSTWAARADEAREMALGLAEAGWGGGVRVRVRPVGLDPSTLVARECAVLAAGAALVVDDGVDADVTIARDRVSGPGRTCSIGALRTAGVAAARAAPGAHEAGLAALAADAVAVVGADVEATHGEMAWALRSVGAWLGAGLPDGPGTIVAPEVPAKGVAPATALVARWWPASHGAALVAADEGRRDVVEVLRDHRPDLVVLPPDGWSAVAGAIRAEAARTRPGAALLRAGRVEAAEHRSPARRTRAARRWSATRLLTAGGLDAARAGVCLGPLGAVDARDLASVGLPVAATWIEPDVPAPVAATTVVRPDADGWGRPLPGRSIEVGSEVVVRGGDVGEGRAVAVHVAVDERGRVAIGSAR